MGPETTDPPCLARQDKARLYVMGFWAVCHFTNIILEYNVSLLAVFIQPKTPPW